MTDHVLELSFKNAKYFAANTDNPDNFKVLPNTLWYSHICNALHVLMGYRPVPTVRKLSRPLEYGWIPELVDVAKNAIVRIDSPTTQTTKTGKTFPYTEIFAGTKPNGTMKSGPFDRGCSKPIMLNNEEKVIATCALDWDRIQYYCQNIWKPFEEMIVAVIGSNYREKSVYYVLSKLNEYHNKRTEPAVVDEFFNKYYLNTKKRNERIGTPLYEIIMNGNTKDQFFHQNGYGIMSSTFIKLILHSPEQVTTISGKIFLKINDEMVNRLAEYGRATAKILEGGMVMIEQIEDDYAYNWKMNTLGAIPAQLEI